MSCVMLILTWLGIIFVLILHLAFAQSKISINIMPPHVTESMGHDMGELFLTETKRLMKMGESLRFPLF
jgi:hypothetical protein